MALTIHGPEGVVRWVYHSAATLGAWTLTVTPAGGDLTATVVSADDFKLSQQGLTFRWSRQNGSAWVWPIQSLHVADVTLTARVGPQE